MKSEKKTPKQPQHHHNHLIRFLEKERAFRLEFELACACAYARTSTSKILCTKEEDSLQIQDRPTHSALMNTEKFQQP